MVTLSPICMVLDALALPGGGAGHADDGDRDPDMGEGHAIGGARQMPGAVPVLLRPHPEQLHPLGPFDQGAEEQQTPSAMPSGASQELPVSRLSV